MPAANRINLGDFDNRSFDRGASRWIEALWLACSALFVESWLPGSRHRVWMLRAFGAQIGERVRIKPRLRVKFPWRLAVGERSWIGEDVWLDNLAQINIGAGCCISQGAYLCTGSHDWTKPAFDLIVKPICIEDEAWIGAKAVVGPGVRVGRGAVLALGGLATHDLDAWMVHVGNPSRPAKARTIGGIETRSGIG